MSRREHLAIRLAWGVAAVLLAAAFASLGFWQYGRADEKARWLDGYARALQAAPKPLAQVLGLPPVDVPVRVNGAVTLRREPVLLLDNQQREGQVGVRAYVLGQVQGAATPVLVELGWLPIGADRALPEVEVPAAAQQIDGVLLPWPGQGLKLAENPWGADASTVLLTYLDRNEIGDHTGTSPYDGVLQPAPSMPLGHVRDAGTLPNTLPPERHRGYAVQWWGLALTVMVVYLILALRRGRE